MLKPILILFSLLTALSGYANTSHDYQIQSLALAKVQSISVHLPDNYNNKKLGITQKLKYMWLL